jgi:ABC-type phosphate/phosphonate transport system substrate-binding protein
MRVLLTCGPIPADPIVAAMSVSFADRSRVREALLRTADHPASHAALAGLFNAGGFAPADPDEIDEVRRKLAPPA